MPFHLQLFGPVSLRQDGVAEHAVRRKSIALLAYLIIEDRALARDHLADLFWPDLPLNKAKRNLSWCLSNLAAYLPDCLLVTLQSVRYVGHVDLVVDTVQAGLWLRQRYLSAQQQALDLMHGPFMDGFTFDDLPELETWHLAQQEIWRQRQQRLFAQVIDGLCALGQAELAVVYARRWVEGFPWAEEAHRALISCLVADGRPDLALDAYAACRRILRKELDVDPSPETEALYREIQSKQRGVSTTAQKLPAQLPLFLTPLIGRDTELDRLTRRLKDPNYRLVSLVGAGGSGKTRLAVAAAEKLHADFGDGVVFVSFAEVPSSAAEAETRERLYAVLAEGLGLAHEPGKRSAQVTRYLAQRHLLIVLDNFEDFVSQADFVLGLLQVAPRLSLLVTSRQPLGVTAEFVLPLVGLHVPDSNDWQEAAQAESVQLFVERMERTFFGVPDAADVRREIVNLCRFVEGSPLAIELLAPLVAQDPSAQWTASLYHNLDLLATLREDLPARQRSLRTVFAQTWGLLIADEQRLLSACAVFKAPFAVDTAAALFEGSAHIRRRLMSLVERSLLKMDGVCFSMHPLVQQFAAEKLAAEPSWQAVVQRAHAQYFMGRLAQAQDKLYTVDEAETIRALVHVREEIFAAWSWCVGQGEVEILARQAHTLSVLCDLRGWWREGETLLAAAAEVATRSAASALLSARLRTRQAVMLFRQSRYAEARQVAGEVLTQLTKMESADPAISADLLAEIAFAEKTLGNIAHLSGDSVTSLSFYRRSLERYRHLRRPIEIAQSLSNLAMPLYMTDNLEDRREAEALLQESLALRRAVGDINGVSVTLSNLGSQAARQQDWITAQRYHLEVLALRRTLDDWPGLARTLDSLAGTAYILGDYAASAAWAAEGEQLSRQLNHDETLARLLILKGRALCALGQYGAAQPALRQGLVLTRRLGVQVNLLFALYALVLGVADGPSPRPVADAVLWPRLVQLTAHVAQNPSTLTSTAQRAQTLLTRLLAAALGMDVYVNVGKGCSLEEAVQVGYQVVEFLKE
jgi:DNA-binding SARP family transcriptional activator/predicted ATPase